MDEEVHEMIQMLIAELVRIQSSLIFFIYVSLDWGTPSCYIVHNVDEVSSSNLAQFGEVVDTKVVFKFSSGFSVKIALVFLCYSLFFLIFTFEQHALLTIIYH